MIVKATRAGLAAARGNPRLVGTLWLVNLTLALAAGVPGWLALRSAIATLPEADALGDSLSLGVLLDLVELRPGLLGGLALSAAGVAALGLLVGAAVAGGALEVLIGRDQRPFAHRFGRGAGRFFVRFVRAGFLGLVAAGLLASLTAGPLFALAAKLRRESGLELVTLAVFGGALLVVGLVLLLALLALDAARIGIVREDARRVLPALGSGAALVLRHPLRWLATWGLNSLLLLAALALYLAFRRILPPGAGPLLALGFLSQQAFVLVRSCLRVALWGSEIALLDA